MEFGIPILGLLIWTIIIGTLPPGRRWVWYILHPGLPGGLGAALGLFMAVQPDVVKAYQGLFEVGAAAFVLWFIPAHFITVHREDRARLARLGRKTLEVANRLYNVMRESNSLQCVSSWIPDDGTAASEAKRKEANEAYQESLTRAINAYVQHNRFEVGNLFEELDENGVRYDSEIKTRYYRLEQDFTPNNIGDLAVVLMDISSNLR
jgi:hypothetical protein